MRTRKPDIPLVTVAVGLLLAVVLWGAFFTDSLNSTEAGALAWVLADFGSLCSGGSLHPSRLLVTMWGVLVGAIALVLLLAGGLEGLQQATILVALPFVVVMLLLHRSSWTGCPRPGWRRHTGQFA